MSNDENYAPDEEAGVDSDAKRNPVDSIGSSTKSRISHSERRPSARFPGDEGGWARRNSGPLQLRRGLRFAPELRRLTSAHAFQVGKAELEP
jgi:hypothetical protein